MGVRAGQYHQNRYLDIDFVVMFWVQLLEFWYILFFIQLGNFVAEKKKVFVMDKMVK